MKSNAKLAFVLVLGALFVGGISSASASAETCHESPGSKKYKLCINGASVSAPSTVPIASTATGAMVLNLENWVHNLKVECTTETEANSSFSEGSTALALMVRPTFKGCSFKGTSEVAKKCLFPGTREFNSVEGSFKSGELLAMKPAAGSVFMEWPVISKEEGPECPVGVRGARSTGGEYACTLHNANVEAVEHELSCLSTKEYVTILSGGPETPLSYTQKVSLSGINKGAKYRVYESA